MLQPSDPKEQVREFWERASCGEEAYAHGADYLASLDAQETARYALEPYIRDFARFAEGTGKDVLEIGVGMGADHLQWARSRPRSLKGVDLTQRAVEHTKARLSHHGFTPDVRQADAEKLPFADASFDIVYSYGVLHCTPDTPKALREVHRVLRPGGVARIMIYHTHSMIGYMLWARYGLMRLQPLRPMRDIFSEHLESPGTKAYTVQEAREMMYGFRELRVWTQLSFGDLLHGAVGQRHRGPLLAAARRLYPRGLVRRFMSNHGLYLNIEAVK